MLQPLQFTAVNMNAFIRRKNPVHDDRTDFIVNDVRFAVRANDRALSSIALGSAKEECSNNEQRGKQF